MPLMIEGGRVPQLWAARAESRRARALQGHKKSPRRVKVALVNNMPDSALEDTELQFFELLDAASGDISVCIELYSLPGIPRSASGHQRLADYYNDITTLWNGTRDCVIMTGTEPQQTNLQDEPYWRVLADTLDWAEVNTSSTILSCLAAHAGVLHSDGIARHPLPDKRFGVFDCRRAGKHVLTNRAGDRMGFPHSRWNEVQKDELSACGYSVLTNSQEAGVDLFVKRKKRSLFVHFQGHPEYGGETLLKEYRRDVRRFLKHERGTYPSMPQGYFDAAATKLLNRFREKALAKRCVDLIAVFPEVVVNGGLESTWQGPATCVYRNWLQYVVSRRPESLSFAVTARAVSDPVLQKQPATA